MEPNFEISNEDGLSLEGTAEVVEAMTKAEEQREQEAEAEVVEAEEVKDQELNLGDRIKDVAVSGAVGIRDTASSFITAPEQVIDFFSGEMSEEAKEGGYDTEWDDWLYKDDDNPYESKTFIGGLVRGASHVTSLLATTGGFGGIAKGGVGLGTRLWRGALTGARFDLLSKTSLNDNVSGILKEKVPFLDTPLATKEDDHPMVKKFKNVLEGGLIGLQVDGILESIGWGLKTDAGKSLLNNLAEGKKVISERAKSVTQQIVEKGKAQKKQVEFGAFKNKPIADPWQGTAFSNETPESVRKGMRSVQNDWGAEEGTSGSFLSNVQVDNIARSSGEARKTIKEVLRKAFSKNKIEQLTETAKRQGKTLDDLLSKDIELTQRIYEGRNTSDLTPEEFWADILAQKFQAQDKFGNIKDYDFVRPEFMNTVDMINGSLLSDIKALGTIGRELSDYTDLRDIDGPAQQLVEKFIAGLRIRKQTNAEWSQMGRDLQSNVKTPRKEIDAMVNADVQKSIDAFRMAMQIAPEDGGDELFKAIFEGISMAKDVHTLDDLDAWMRLKMRGGSFKGQPEKVGALVKEFGTMMTHSVLSGPKTAVRAIMGTSSAAFTRPMAMAMGGLMKGDWMTSRAGLAALNGMREAIPESFELFKRRLNAYWSGDISTYKTRFIERSKLDNDWEFYGHWAETRGTKVDKAVFRSANLVRAANDNRFLTYSTKIMAATDDAFGLIIGRARAREKAFLEAAENLPDGDYVNLDETFFKNMEDKFNKEIFDVDGNITDDAAAYSKREATLTQDLTGFTKKLEKAFGETPWARPFFLFARTGINGLQLTAKHTPGFNLLVKEYREIRFAKPGGDLSGLQRYGIKNARDLINAKAVADGRIAMGSIALSMASIAYLNGGLHGNGPTDRKKKQAWIAAGYKPRTIKIGNVWVNYDSFEPYNQILALVGDIGDHMDLMGEEWAEEKFQKLAVALSGTITSKSYLAGLQSMVDLFSGQPGQQNRIIASLMNNTLPLSSLRNEIGKVLTPYTRELSSDIQDSIRNRNLITENIALDPLPIKYDILTGDPIKDHNFITRMFNAVSPVNFNLDYSPGRQFLFNSGYDLSNSLYSAPDGTDLSKSPKVRSMYQQAIGKQNLLRKLDNLANEPGMQASLAEMFAERRAGRSDTEPRSFAHYKRITTLFHKAKLKAWADIRRDNNVEKLILEERDRKIQNIKANERTIDKILQIYK
tara:strand:+ start:217 stop:3879 length:3663 start_codon:yes stop_codon:yes gene_type:complete